MELAGTGLPPSLAMVTVQPEAVTAWVNYAAGRAWMPTGSLMTVVRVAMMDTPLSRVLIDFWLCYLKVVLLAERNASVRR